MWKSLVLGVGMLVCFSLTTFGVCEAQLNLGVGYGRMFVISGDNPTVKFDNIAASMSWTVGHLWVLGTLGEDNYGAILAGYGGESEEISYGIGPVFRWFDKGALGVDDDAFAIGAQAKVGFDLPSGDGSVIPTELVFGWSRSIKNVHYTQDSPVKLLFYETAGGCSFNTVSFEIITNFPVRR